MSSLIECVPNFSEGADLALVDDIVAAVKVPCLPAGRAKVLDVHSDPDHNRTVVTILGEPDSVKQAAYELTERAMQLLDVNEHEGAHPFIGVVDVIPFVPVKNITKQEVIRLAHDFGKELWEKLALPVYFYGDAAKKDERKELPEVRRGGFKALKAKINDSHRQPDVGHGLHHLAGAVAVGARDFLVAFNVNLKANDVDIAKSIAKNIREKSGGLKGVRALGLELRSKGISQVSINLCDHEETSLARVFEQVEMWAKEYKVEILSSEIVGMIPEEVYYPEMKERLKLIYLPKILEKASHK